MILAERHRPATWDAYVGQDKAKALVRRIIERDGFDRGAFWIEGSGDNNSGIGKTSLAWLIARALAGDWNIELLAGAEVTRERVREWGASRTVPMGTDAKPFRVIIIDEAHSIGAQAVDLLLPFLEALPRHWVVVFTTTRKVDEGLFGNDAGPFASRTVRVCLTNQGLAEAFARRAQAIAEAEGLGGAPAAKYIALAKECRNNLRAMLQRVQAGECMAESAVAA